jgi:hypothetical protein
MDGIGMVVEISGYAASRDANIHYSEVDQTLGFILEEPFQFRGPQRSSLASRKRRYIVLFRTTVCTIP